MKDSDSKLIFEKYQERKQPIVENTVEACPGCGCMPGDGLTEGCDDPNGCGYWRSHPEHPNYPDGPETSSAPEEKKEIEIGKQIIHYANQVSGHTPAEQACLSQIDKLANELIKMHGSKVPNVPSPNVPSDYSKMNPEEKHYVRTGGGK